MLPDPMIGLTGGSPLTDDLPKVNSAPKPPAKSWRATVVTRRQLPTIETPTRPPTDYITPRNPFAPRHHRASKPTITDRSGAPGMRPRPQAPTPHPR